jgi:mycothiol synthase
MQLEYRRIESLAAQRNALIWLLRDLPLPEQAVHSQVLEQALAGEEANQQLYFYAAYAGEIEHAVVLAQIQSGKTALLWPPRVIATTQVDVRPLLQALLTALRNNGIEVVQALLLPTAKADRANLINAGFASAADLIYMTAERSSFPQHCPPSFLEWENIACDDARLQRLVQATYQGSLDCPVIDGWRQIDDVLRGYRETGTFNPSLWWIAKANNQEVGCLILADYPETHQWELVYLGVHPAHRGNGWGEAMVLWMQHLALKQDVDRIILAVDAANHPALNIYGDCGFLEFDRRVALACRL